MFIPLLLALLVQPVAQAQTAQQALAQGQAFFPAQAPVFQQDEFARNLIDALEFIDYPDLLLAITLKNNAPWTRFDVPGQKRTLLERWRIARSEPAVSADFEEQLLRVHQIFQEIPDNVFQANKIGTSYRFLPIDDAGGDIGRDPSKENFQPVPAPRTQAQVDAIVAFQKQVRANPGFFDEVSQEQLNVLKANPFLQVESHSVAEIMKLLGRPIRDPSGTEIPSDLFLVRYKYPSAKRWREFTNFLSQPLQARLAQAEAQQLLEYNPLNLRAPFNPANPSLGGVSPTFMQLNQLLLRELLRARFDPRDSGPNFYKNYQRMIAVHPFQDFNGRSLRVFYRRMVGRPLFVLNFNHDLYTDTKAFERDVRAGEAGFELLMSGMTQELIAHQRRAVNNRSDLPRFFDIPEWWVFAAGPDAGRALIPALARVNGFGELNPLAQRLVNESKNWISQLPIKQRIDKKLFDQLFIDYVTRLRGVGLVQ